MIGTTKPIIVRPAVFREWSSYDAQRRIISQLIEQKLEVVRLKGNIRIKAGHDVVWQMFKTRVARIKTDGFASEIPGVAFWHPEQFDPVVLDYIATDDLICVIPRTVADDEPAHRPHGLSNNRLNCLLDKRSLVFRRRNQQVPQALVAHFVPKINSLLSSLESGFPTSCSKSSARALYIVAWPQWSIGVFAFSNG